MRNHTDKEISREKDETEKRLSQDQTTRQLKNRKRGNDYDRER